MKWWVWVLIGVSVLVVLGIIGSALGDPEDGSTPEPACAMTAAGLVPTPLPEPGLGVTFDEVCEWFDVVGFDTLPADFGIAGLLPDNGMTIEVYGPPSDISKMIALFDHRLDTYEFVLLAGFLVVAVGDDPVPEGMLDRAAAQMGLGSRRVVENTPNRHIVFEYGALGVGVWSVTVTPR